MAVDVHLHWSGCVPAPYRKAPIGIEHAFSFLTVQLTRNLTFKDPGGITQTRICPLHATYTCDPST